MAKNNIFGYRVGENNVSDGTSWLNGQNGINDFGIGSDYGSFSHEKEFQNIISDSHKVLINSGAELPEYYKKALEDNNNLMSDANKAKQFGNYINLGLGAVNAVTGIMQADLAKRTFRQNKKIQDENMNMMKNKFESTKKQYNNNLRRTGMISASLTGKKYTGKKLEEI